MFVSSVTFLLPLEAASLAEHFLVAEKAAIPAYLEHFSVTYGQIRR